MKIIDLFCGCGGLSLGAHNAGFETALAIDIDTNLRSAYRRNFIGRRAVGLDLTSATPRTLRSHMLTDDIVGVIGGPPCQGFSVMGRGQQDDPRNSLVAKYLKLATALKPAFFLMENVPGFLAERHSTLRESALAQIPSRYRVIGPIKLNAADYGAATKRERVILIGFDPEKMDPITHADLEAAKIEGPKITVRDAIGDLAGWKSSALNEFGFDWARLDRRLKRSDYAARLHSEPPLRYLKKPARRLYGEGYVTGFELTEHQAETIKRFDETAPGKQEPVSRYQRLDWDSTAPTLRAGTGADRGSYQAARPIHPDQPRVITVREAARIQGFPDWFMFHPTKWHSHRMIGNSVSPIFAEAIMRVIASKLEITPRDTLELAAE